MFIDRQPANKVSTLIAIKHGGQEFEHQFVMLSQQRNPRREPRGDSPDVFFDISQVSRDIAPGQRLPHHIT